MRACCYGFHVEDLIAGVGKAVVAVPVDPGEEVARAAGHHDLHGAAICTIFPGLAGDSHAVLIVGAGAVIAAAAAPGVPVLLPVEFAVDFGAQLDDAGIGNVMPRAVVLSLCQVVGGGKVAEIHICIQPNIVSCPVRPERIQISIIIQISQLHDFTVHRLIRLTVPGEDTTAVVDPHCGYGVIDQKHVEMAVAGQIPEFYIITR